MSYLVELNQDNQNNYISVKEAELDQHDVVRGWRVRYEAHTFDSLEEVANFILNNYEVTDYFFYLNKEDREHLLVVINKIYNANTLKNYRYRKSD